MELRLKSEEQEQLVLNNKRLVYYIAKGFRIENSDFEDVISVGTIGLIKAAATFDESKKIKFVTYASQCIQNEIRMYFRKQKSYVNILSLEETIYSDCNGKEITLSEKIASLNKDFTDEIEERHNFAKVISIILNVLNTREKLIILYEFAGCTQAFVAKTLNLSQSYISRIQKKAHNKIEKYFKSEKKFKEIFLVQAVDYFYKITFYSKDVKSLNKIIEEHLTTLESTEYLPFNIDYDEEQITIRIIADSESFYLIAKIIQEI